MLYLVPVELFLNLAWLVFSVAALLAWIRWWHAGADNAIPLARGVVIVICILVLLLPAISISDDLAQTPALAEGVKLQDTLAAPESLVSPGTLPSTLLLACLNPLESKATFLVQPESRAFPPELHWIPAVEKRPPPISA